LAIFRTSGDAIADHDSGGARLMLPSERHLFGPRRPESSAGVELTAEKEQALRQFVALVGGLDNARRALDLWALLNSHKSAH
jgi:hypothetical protein